MALNTAETRGITTLEPAHQKIYVLDTNVLLHDPTAVTAFAEHHVVIPMTVLEELDRIKDRRDKTVSREARIAIQLIDKVVGNQPPNDIQSGVPIPGSNLMSVGWERWRFSPTNSSPRTPRSLFSTPMKTKLTTTGSLTLH